MLTFFKKKLTFFQFTGSGTVAVGFVCACVTVYVRVCMRMCMCVCVVRRGNEQGSWQPEQIPSKTNPLTLLCKEKNAHTPPKKMRERERT